MISFIFINQLINYIILVNNTNILAFYIEQVQEQFYKQMIGAGIKCGSTQYLNALQDTMKACTNIKHPKKPVKMHLINLLASLSDICSQFQKSSNASNFNLFIIDHYIRKFQKQSDLQRYFYGFLESWKRNLDHGDCKVYLSLLRQQRNDKKTIKLFIRIKKAILKNICYKVMQDIFITHEDAVTLAHSLFQPTTKNFIIGRVNELFVSLKRKFINNANVDGAVISQFFINCIQQKRNADINQKMNQARITQGTIKEGARVKNQRTRNQDESPPLYNLSFSQQYAEYYSKSQNEQSYEKSKQTEGDAQKENQYMQNEQMEKEQAKLGFTMNPNDKYTRKYPTGWQNFLKRHQIVKKKLLKPNISIDVEAANANDKY